MGELLRREHRRIGGQETRLCRVEEGDSLCQLGRRALAILNQFFGGQVHELHYQSSSHFQTMTLSLRSFLAMEKAPFWLALA